MISLKKTEFICSNKYNINKYYLKYNGRNTLVIENWGWKKFY